MSKAVAGRFFVDRCCESGAPPTRALCAGHRQAELMKMGRRARRRRVSSFESACGET
nr:hypothetical protein [Endozoicomonas atrinae]